MPPPIYHNEYEGGESVKNYIIRYRPALTVFFIYTVIFVILSRLAVYALPFAISLIVAVVMKPVYDFLRRRFLFRSAFAATAITLLIFGAALSIVGFLLYLVVSQGLSLFDRYGYLIQEYISYPELWDSIRNAALSGDLLGTLSDIAASLFRAVPLSLTFVIITFALTVFLLNRLGEVRDALLRLAGEAHREQVSRVLATSYRLSRRFIRSYLILYLITFIEAVFVFYLTGVDYPLAFAFITAAADILPVLGPGAVYVPLAVSFILQGNYLPGATLLVFFLITVILRQISEPKLVSSSVKLHPLIALAAIYFSIAAMSVWVFFYVILLFLLFRVLKISEVL